MKCKILHESKGRMRVHLEKRRMTLNEADVLEYYMRSVPGVTDIKVYDRTGDAIIKYTAPREQIISALSAFAYTPENAALVPDHTGRALNREFEDKLVASICFRAVQKLFFPTALRTAWTVLRSVSYIRKGLRSLMKGKLEVSVLDATAIVASILQKDYDTASSVMFLLNIGELLEDWTHKKSIDDLARTMSLNVDKVWTRVNGEDILLPVSDIVPGDLVIVRTGSMIPLDGKVIEGEAMVNQASLTGEPLPVRKTHGGYAYAGTVVEDGECVIKVEKTAGGGHYDRIVKMIEQSEKLKSSTESKASHLADRLVPYSLGGTALTWLLTRNVTKAMSILMVDFSCAIKLSMPVAVLSAMRECGTYNISVKGGKFLEAVSEADTIVFDKTGTLTHASPRVAKIVTFNGEDETEMLRMAACMEEHYPHSIANAVVNEALIRGINHEERHSKVEYIVAHGISSITDGKKVVIGSYHFTFEDENCHIPEGEEEKFNSLPDEYSHLYMATDGVLSAVILIEDPLRDEAAEVIRSLKELGIGRTVMMTGDSERTARAIAKRVGVDEYYSEVLPEDKADFVRAEHEAGRKVIMVGDGINDSPALSEADAGIAISTGAAIAREIADITISAEDLYAFVTLKKLSDALMTRIHRNYRFIITFNMLLIALGVTGILPPTTSALLHNTSTIGIGLKNMTNLI